ncbi:hypothetical protein BKA66DRAFT_546026 [Pyrenochaeta sp. MPI-SDFR-AT-0127]|nr:hypothetical protein BKA66DRAFT_546026 [Pyrenochaeta sp. MPI-SDFR-AT-0127]
MPTEAENIQYLYLVLTSDGAPNIDWDAVGAALDLKKGAVSKRWSRLKLAMEKGEKPSSATYQFLWHCVQHNKRITTLDWDVIAKKCNTTPGAASKRYSRMKQAFEQDIAIQSTSPGSTTKIVTTKPKSNSKKARATTSSDDEVEPKRTPKRKRVSPKKKVVTNEEQKIKPEAESDDTNASEDETNPKRVKVTKTEVTPKPNTNSENTMQGTVNDTTLLTPTTEATTLIKGEHDDGDDVFYDAQEAQFEDLMDGNSDLAADLSAKSLCNAKEGCAMCECHAKEIANVLMGRSSGLATHQRLELENLVGVVDLTN